MKRVKNERMGGPMRKLRTWYVGIQIGNAAFIKTLDLDATIRKVYSSM